MGNIMRGLAAKLLLSGKVKEFKKSVNNAMGHLTFWISLLLRPKTKRLNFGLSPEFRLTITAAHITAHSITSSLILRISLFIYD